jgi:hypothetical protein
MKTVKSFSSHCVLAVLVVAAACITPGVSADVLTNTWFKLTLSTKGHTLGTNNITVKRLNITRTVYLNIGELESSTNRYNLNLWTKVDGVWSNSFNATPTSIGVNENFFSDLFLTFRSSSNSTLNTYHTAFINVKTNAAGRLRGATYTGRGEVYNGDLNGRRYFGGFSLIGPQTSPSRLPFTP